MRTVVRLAAAALLCCWLPAGVALSAGLDQATCLAEIGRAERANNLPPNLLRAIALVETGRPANGGMVPWAWSLDVNGAGEMFGTKEAAIGAVESKLAIGATSIDVGCMQINLAHHPRAFSSLEEAFDPEANVRYATRFLLSLYRKSGDWAQAAMAYHSQTPDLGAGYLRRVATFWPAGAAALPMDRTGGAGRKMAVSGNYTPEFASWVERNAADAAGVLAAHRRTMVWHTGEKSLVQPSSIMRRSRDP